MSVKTAQSFIHDLVLVLQVDRRLSMMDTFKVMITWKNIAYYSDDICSLVVVLFLFFYL